MKFFVTGVVTGLALVVGLGWGAPASAQQPAGPAAPPTRVAFVNAQMVLRSMPGYAQAESTYTKELEGSRTEMARLQAGLDSAVAEFDQQQAMLSSTNRAARRKELETRGQQLQQRGEEITRRLQQRERELLSPMQERTTSIIEGIRAEGNYAMIVDLGTQGLGIITYDKTLDLTQRVIQRLRQTN